METIKYKEEQKSKSVQITFHADRQINYGQQALHRGGYLFLQSFYYRLQMDRVCRKLRDKYRFKYDINAILSDMIYARILEPSSKRSSYAAASEFLEKPSYQLHDVYRALDVLGNECDFIQSEIYKDSHLLGSRNDKVLYYDCTNYYFGIEQEDGDKNTGNVRSTVPTRLFKWDCSWMEMVFPSLFHFSPGMPTSRHLLSPWKKRSFPNSDAKNLYTAAMPVLALKKSGTITIWENVHLSSHSLSKN